MLNSLIKLFQSSIAAIGIFFAMSGSTVFSEDTHQETFFKNLKTLCGKAFEGKVISNDAADADLAKERLVMHVRTCERNRILIPFHVGNNRSRTWVITKDDTSLTLKHDHRHEDGSEDKVTQYGGVTLASGTDVRQAFPADKFSKDMFTENGLTVSLNNTWAVEMTIDEHFIYELSRPGRLFRVSFDLTNPIALPPAPWGHE